MDNCDHSKLMLENYSTLSECVDSDDDIKKDAGNLLFDECSEMWPKTGEPGKRILPFYIGYITPEMEVEAEQDLNETHETKKKALERMKSLIENEKNLFCPNIENYSMKFLRAKKFDVEESFTMLRNYFMFRKTNCAIFDNIDFESVKRIVSENVFGFLPFRDYEGSVIFVANLRQWNFDLNSFEQAFCAVTLCIGISIEDPATQVTGYRIILDLRHLRMKHLKLATPKNLSLIFYSTQHCFPGRYRGIHILSNNRLFSIAWALSVPFLTSKLRERIFLHEQDVQSISNFIDPSVLPEELGGNGPPFDGSKTLQMILDNTDLVHEMLQHGYKM